MPRVNMKTMKCGIQIAAWIAFVMVCAMTVGPIWTRPVSHLSADHERFAAFAVLGVLFMLAYPKRPFPVLIFLAAAAGALELAQTAIPGRHGRFEDFVFKAAGVAVAVGTVHIFQLIVANSGLSRRPR
jgi:hypothetical protein